MMGLGAVAPANEARSGRNPAQMGGISLAFGFAKGQGGFVYFPVGPADGFLEGIDTGPGRQAPRTRIIGRRSAVRFISCRRCCLVLTPRLT